MTMLPRLRVERGASIVLEDVEDLALVAAVELQRVKAGAAIREVRAVARIPDDDVIAGAAELIVGALVAVDQIVAAAAKQDLMAQTALQLVVTGSAGEDDLQGCGERVARRIEGDAVVAARPVDHDGAEIRGREREVGDSVVVDVQFGDGGIACGRCTWIASANGVPVTRRTPSWTCARTGGAAETGPATARARRPAVAPSTTRGRRLPRPEGARRHGEGSIGAVSE